LDPLLSMYTLWVYLWSSESTWSDLNHQILCSINRYWMRVQNKRLLFTFRNCAELMQIKKRGIRTGWHGQGLIGRLIDYTHAACPFCVHNFISMVSMSVRSCTLLSDSDMLCNWRQKGDLTSSTNFFFERKNIKYGVVFHFFTKINSHYKQMI
jgi:hypothetical protein